MNEKEILKFWEKNKIFQKSLQQAQGKPLFSFYDGPPFLSGKPHYGHILTATIKDTVARYKTMKGFNVPRRVGWDCHGLPVENFIEKELNVKSKKEIEEKIGIEKFNKAARDSVFSCLEIFQKTLKRVGRWADYTDSYMTLDNSYIESVWWVLKQLWERGLVYKDYRVSPYCPRCGTPLSNFEVNLGYKDVSDPSIYIKFKIKNKENAYFLVWTTTPWTLTANVALAIGNDI
ncbi:class I tRNA ligase family protein, partial [Patescibacteria group bacterium]|nr:class I tRNA ligase family protein [Patescibacteria group bacterium]